MKNGVKNIQTAGYKGARNEKLKKTVFCKTATGSQVVTKGPFKYYIIMFLTFLGPPTQVFDDLQYRESSRIAIF